MEPTQANPARKRRRWLIIAFVLVLVSLCSWWYWPRGDARFVGTWNVYAGDNGQPHSVATFRSSGIVEYQFLDGSGRQVTTWTFVADKMVFGVDQQSWLSKAINYAGVPNWLWVEQLAVPIKFVGRDEFRQGLASGEQGQETVYRRIPE